MSQYCFCFYVFGLGPRGMWALSPQPGINFTPSALKGEVLTTGMAKKSLYYSFKNYYISFRCLTWWFYTFKHYEMIMAIRPTTTHYHTKLLSHYWPCSLRVHYTLMTYWIYSWRFVPLTTLLLKYFLAYPTQSRVQSLGHIAISMGGGGEGAVGVVVQ